MSKTMKPILKDISSDLKGVATQVIEGERPKLPPKRNLNLDLIRCVAIFFVISVHFLLNTSFLFNCSIWKKDVFIGIIQSNIYVLCITFYNVNWIFNE